MLVTYSFIILHSLPKKEQMRMPRNLPSVSETEQEQSYLLSLSLLFALFLVSDLCFMEKHECKLCFRSFPNGRALGGHMRSHMKKLPLPTKREESPPILLSFEAESASSPSSSSDEEDKGLSYGLRENPKRSIRMADPEFSFVVDTGSVILQDRESETESSKNPTRRRSKRAWKLGGLNDQYHHGNQIQEQEAMKKLKSNKPSKTESWVVEPETVSSISDATTEEDVAFCLMMLSRDKWKRQKDQDRWLEDQDDDEEEEDDDKEAERSLEDTDKSEEFKSSKTRLRGRYTCETCNKVFRSYQALGGHRASHKKIKVPTAIEEPELEVENGGASSAPPMAANAKKIHECPFCFRVFSSGQALGGHKRTHITGSAARIPIRASPKLVEENLLDLNLPAPMEDDEISQIENSAVSYAEFVNPIKQ